MAVREKLVECALEWQRRYGVAPAITASLSEYDAAMLVGCPEADYQACMVNRTAVSKGHDFVFNGHRYQIKANRPSGKPGSKVTLVAKAKNYDWDYLIWLHYSPDYLLQEAWLWEVEAYRHQFDNKRRLSPCDMRQGQGLLQEYPQQTVTKSASGTRLELNSDQRQQLLQDFLDNKITHQCVYYEKHRLYFDRGELQHLSPIKPYFILRISPTTSAIKQGYQHGYVVLTHTELNTLFGHYFDTPSWQKLGCYHLPKPNAVMNQVFIPADHVANL